MSAFYKEIVVSKEDLDDLHHVNNVRYVQWIQDISKEHWIATAPKKAQEELIWFVLSHQINYKSAAFLNDIITIKTFIEQSKGATCSRIVEMTHGKTNKLIVRSTTEWCLANKKTQKPMRISEDIKRIFL